MHDWTPRTSGWPWRRQRRRSPTRFRLRLVYRWYFNFAKLFHLAAEEGSFMFAERISGSTYRTRMHVHWIGILIFSGWRSRANKMHGETYRFENVLFQLNVILNLWINWYIYNMIQSIFYPYKCISLGEQCSVNLRSDLIICGWTSVYLFK